MQSTQELVVGFLTANPSASNEEVAAYVKSQIPGSKCSASSVATIKSRNGIKTSAVATLDPDVLDEEPLEVAEKRIAVRYSALERMTDRLAKGEIPSLIVSGPPGLGKSFTMRKAIEDNVETDVEFDMTKKDREALAQMLGDDGKAYRYTDWIGGGVSTIGLYKALWNCSQGGILVLDDADEIFRDEVSLNLLKVALDSGRQRIVSWRRESNWLKDDEIPDRFDFQGHVCFITNIDFEAEINTGRRDAEHFKALIDRSMYLCLTLRTARDFMIRIRQIALGENGMLVKHFGLTEEQAVEVVEFVDDNKERFYNLSLRLCGQIAICMKADEWGWKEDIEATKMRTL